MKPVFASQDPTAVAIVRGLLADEGIETTLQNQNMSAVTGGVPFQLAMPEVWVMHDEDEGRARAVVESFEEGQAGERQPTESWRCPQCGEQVEGQFTACWNCGTPKPSG